MTRAELENKMTVLLGGRAAEFVVFGHLSTGAADDLAKVTDIARSMVMRYGMAEKLGSVSYEGERPTFLGDIAGITGRNYSEETAREIDCAVRELVQTGFKRATGVVQANRELMEQWVQRLLEKETLGEQELTELASSVVRAG